MSSGVYELEKGFDMHNVPNSPLHQVTAFLFFFFVTEATDLTDLSEQTTAAVIKSERPAVALP